MIKEKVLKTIREHGLLENKKHIVLGLSGGPDSVCLFYVLLELKDEMGFSIHPVHVNHKLRPGDAERDQEYVENLCMEKGCPCKTYTADCGRIAKEKKITCEEAGRLVRYGAFADAAAKLRAQGIPEEEICIAVAQNADDQAETILFRILRGTGTDGLSGIRYKRRDEFGNLIIRPLLDVTRKETEMYCGERHLEPRTDKTNLKPLYTRNRIRLDLIPYLEEHYNGNIKETLVRTGKNAASDSDYIRREAEKAFASAVKERSGNYIILDGAKLKKLHRALRQRVIKMAFKAEGLAGDMSSAHFEGCEAIVFQKRPSARFDLPKGFYISKVYGDVKVGKKGPVPSFREGKPSMEILTIEEYADRKKIPSRFAAFDYDEMERAFGENFEKGLALRGREPGDRFPFTEDHTKKVQDYFVDMKIPKDERENVLLLALGHEILWILPQKGKGRYSARYKVDDKTKKVFFIEMII